MGEMSTKEGIKESLDGCFLVFTMCWVRHVRTRVFILWSKGKFPILDLNYGRKIQIDSLDTHFCHLSGQCSALNLVKNDGINTT